MARPRTFDIDTAVEKAMNLFWRNGYQSTNLPDLLDAMGIVRGSFYKAFGSKKELFLLALARYEKLYVEPGLRTLNDETVSGGKAIKSVFQGTIAAAQDGEKRGCLLCSSAAETSFHDKEIKDAVDMQLEKLISGFATALSREPAFAEKRKPTIFAEAARLAHSYVGLRILQRSGRPVGDLKVAVNREMAALT